MYELPENGYLTPRFPDLESGYFSKADIHEGERRRHVHEGGGGETNVEIHGRSINLDGHAPMAQKGKEEEPKVFGIRDRISCYTWTWFTMNMATGGIANVLHSSTRCCSMKLYAF